MSKKNHPILTFITILSFLLLTIFVSGLDDKGKEKVNADIGKSLVYIEMISKGEIPSVEKKVSVEVIEDIPKKDDFQLEKITGNSGDNDLFSWEKDVDDGLLVITLRNGKVINIPLFVK